MLEHSFPNLQGKNYSLESPEDHQYNCIAHAAHDNMNWWWPDPDLRVYWPSSDCINESIECFVRVFVEEFGYELCDSDEYEPGYEKVALYARNGSPTHMARQLPSGYWTSKLGKHEDIEHPDLESLCGDVYGEVAHVFRRQS